jgi:hypothetical protein
MLCDGSVVGVAIDDAGQPLAVGTKARVPSPKVQRALTSATASGAPIPGVAEQPRKPTTSSTGSTPTAPTSTSSPASAATTTAARAPSTSTPTPARSASPRPDGGPILGRAATSGTPHDIPRSFPVEPGTVPTRWDGSPLLLHWLTPPRTEHDAPSSLRFGAHQTTEKLAATLARTLACTFQQQGDIWVTSTPDLITITPEPAGGRLITIELTTRPHRLATVLTGMGLTLLRPQPPDIPAAGDP